MFKGRKDSDLLGVIANDWMVGVLGLFGFLLKVEGEMETSQGVKGYFFDCTHRYSLVALLTQNEKHYFK